MSKKGTKALASATLMSLVLTTALNAGPVKAATGQVTRIGASDRYATAAQVATSNWTTSDNVVLVSGEGYADAVSASALAKQLNAPILLTTAGSLNTDTANALSQLKAKNIYIVGGDASVSQAVRDQLKANYTLIELGGANRYETNAAVAQKLVDLGVKADNVIMVGGEGFSDALSVAPIAAAKGQILLLGMNDANYMKPVLDFVSKNNSKVTVVGTKNVISDAILNQVNGTRVDGGSDRWDTNLKVLSAFKDAVKNDKLYVASASYNAKDDGYADALVASALAGKSAAPLVLVDKEGSTGTNNAISYIKSFADKTKTDLNVVGGTGVVSDGLVTDINNAVQGTPSTTPDATVQSIEDVNLNEIKVHFNSPIDSDSAENVTNYKIDGTTLTQLDANNKATDENAAVAKAVDDNTVVITLSHPRKQNDKVTVSVKKAILTKDKNSTIDSFDQDVTFSDTTAPTLKNVTVEGNSQITVEFSESMCLGGVNNAIRDLESKVKIDGQSISNYGVNETYSTVKNEMVVDNDANGSKGTWGFKVLFYFDSPLSSGNHTLKISDGDNSGNKTLCDAAGFTFQEASQDFTVDSMSTKPVIKSVKETSSGEVHVEFDRSMDVQTAGNLANYKINDKKLSDISGASFDTDNNDTIIKLKGVGDAINTGANTLYISDNVKDAYGNKVDTDTRVNFDDVKDDTKPTVKDVSIIDSETIRVRFSKDVNYQFATNISNYKLQDNKDLDITNHIAGIYSTKGQTNTDNTDLYDIKLTKFNPKDSNDDWRLTGGKYTLTIKNIIDTASTPNTMEDYSAVINGTDNVAPKGTGIYAKLGATNSSDKDKVVIYFSEPMDSDTLTNRDNFKFESAKGDWKSLPTDASISTGGDNKSAIIEFPSSYHVRPVDANGAYINGFDINNGGDNDVIQVSAANVKDQAGNLLDTTAFSGKISDAGTRDQVKPNTLRVYYDNDDLKVDVQFDRALDQVNKADFTFGGVAPSSTSVQGDKLTLTFKDGDLETGKTVTYSNGQVNNAPTKIEVIKALGQQAYLGISGSVTSTDETGTVIAPLAYDANDSTSVSQAKVYDYEAAPRTTCFDNDTPDYWTAVRNSDGSAEIGLTFDTPLDPNSGVKSDDFTFAGSNGTELKADSVKIDGNTVKFDFDSTNKNISAFTSKIRVSAKSSVSLRTQKDVDGNNASYTPSNDDLKIRYITVSGSAVTTADATIEQAGTAIVGKTVVVASLKAGLDPTQYDVTVNGTTLTYNSATGKYTGTLDGTYTVSDLQAKTVVTKKSSTTLPTATVEQAGTAIVGKTVVVASLPSTVDATKYNVTVNGTTLTYNATTGKFTGTLDGTYTVSDLQAKTVVSAQ